MRIEKIKLISNNICYGPEPSEYDEVEQHLVIRRDGRCWLTRYRYGGGFGHFELSEKKQSRFYQGKAEAILSKIEEFCEEYYPISAVKDCGDWSMTVWFDNGEKAEYSNLLTDFNKNLTDVSVMIRIELDDFEIFAFDGNTEYPLWDYNPISIFSKYLPLLYDNTLLWNKFQKLCKEYFRDRREDSDFFAFHRDVSCIQIWRAFLDNMGGGVPFSFYQAAAFLILAHKEAGHDIDKELMDIHNSSAEIGIVADGHGDHGK